MADSFTYTVERISCSSCRALVTEELEDLAGVTGVDVDLDTKQVTIRGDGIEDATLRETLSSIGYAASPA